MKVEVIQILLIKSTIFCDILLFLSRNSYSEHLRPICGVITTQDVYCQISETAYGASK